jgi:hypothetical protein
MLPAMIPGLRAAARRSIRATGYSFGKMVSNSRNKQTRESANIFVIFTSSPETRLFSKRRAHQALG